MNLDFTTIRVDLIHTFTVASSSSKFRNTVVVTLSDNDTNGTGEAPSSSRYAEDDTSITKFLEDARDTVTRLDDPFCIEELWVAIDRLSTENMAAKSGLNIALFDLVGKKLGVPVYQLLGLNPAETPITSFTIGIDQPEKIKLKVAEAEPHPVLKVKLGQGDLDYDIIKTIKNATDKPIRVDANEGWQRDEAVRKIEWLATQKVEYVEQPLPADRLDDMKWVHERSALPVFADENVKRASDIPGIAALFDGVNIKLAKAGGITGALKAIHTARAHGLKVMLGCMVETAVASTAAAHLSPLVDYADLDSTLLTKNDPFEGVKIVDGKLVLGREPGLDVRKKT